VPEGLSLLTELRDLHLSKNQFTGLLPVQVLGSLSPNIRALSLENNALVVTASDTASLTGQLPKYVGGALEKNRESSFLCVCSQPLCVLVHRHRVHAGMWR